MLATIDVRHLKSWKSLNISEQRRRIIDPWSRGASIVELDD